MISDKRADELPKLDTDLKLILYMNEKCVNCKHFDEYDVCLCSKHWGSVINNTIAYCEKYGSFKEK